MPLRRKTDPETAPTEGPVAELRPEALRLPQELLGRCLTSLEDLLRHPLVMALAADSAKDALTRAYKSVDHLIPLTLLEVPADEETLVLPDGPPLERVDG